MARDSAVYGYNRSAMADDRGAMIPAMISDGYRRKGEVVTGYLPITNGFATQFVLEDVAGRFRAAYADREALSQASATVRARECTLEKLAENHLRGEYTAKSGQKLLFTIPYDEGWACWIDGNPMKIEKTLGAFMAVETSEGAHSYEMRFFPVGMRTGMYASLVAMILTILFIALDFGKRARAAG